MKQEDKKLLLKDLSARLPYGVLIHCHTLDTKERLFGVNLLNVETEYTDASPVISVDEEGQEGCYSLEEIKPYLRPMSSMTQEETEMYDALAFDSSCIEMVDWMNMHYIDYRGLIDNGLALEAPSGMYKI